MRSWRRFSSIALVFAASCSVDSAKNHYFLGEKLWGDRNYGAAVVEFEKVIAKDPAGKFGRQALLRVALTEYLYLNRFYDAVRHFRLFVQGAKSNPADDKLVFEAQVHIGEILFSKVERFEEAIAHYQGMLKQFPNAKEGPEFLYRVAKSYFYLYQFGRALEAFKEVSLKHEASEFAIQSQYEIGRTLLTQGSEFCPQAIESFKGFLKKYPSHQLAVEAEFGVASCLEELDHLDDALHKFESIRSKYVSPQVVDVKIERIRQRLKQRHRER